MNTKIHIYSGLQSYTKNQDIIEVNGSTVGECLNDLARQFPNIRRSILDPEGKLLPSVLVSINLQSPHRETLEKLIVPGDEIYIILIIPGG